MANDFFLDVRTRRGPVIADCIDAHVGQLSREYFLELACRGATLGNGNDEDVRVRCVRDFLSPRDAIDVGL